MENEAFVGFKVRWTLATVFLMGRLTLPTPAVMGLVPMEALLVNPGSSFDSTPLVAAVGVVSSPSDGSLADGAEHGAWFPLLHRLPSRGHQRLN